MARKKEEQPMPYDVRNECFRLRCKSKRGQDLTAQEMRQCERWMKLYPEQYKAMSKEVFEQTAPFGARL